METEHQNRDKHRVKLGASFHCLGKKRRGSERCLNGNTSVKILGRERMSVGHHPNFWMKESDNNGEKRAIE